jgi:hypothetical protein
MNERDEGGSVLPPTFQDIAELVAGTQTPPWLAGHLEWWAASLSAARMVDKHRPSKASMKKKLEEVKLAALLLEKSLNDTPTRKFLEIASPGRVKTALVYELADLTKRAEYAAASPILSTAAGKTKSGRGKALMNDDLSAKSYCAAMIAEAWLFFRHCAPGTRDRRSAKAADDYWLASGGPSQGWGEDRLNGWRPHFEKVRASAEVPAIVALRAIWRRDLLQSARMGGPPWFLPANN